MTTDRPDPDALLRRIAAADRPHRGRLKVFFGAAPGVGKTFAMLEAARLRRAEGIDVVIGWVETHGRAETAALAEGFERLPVQTVAYRDMELRDFDLAAALRRKPGLLLLDELAHTNAPGLRHAKRWQDVEDLRDSGIDVYTTLNVQHVESLNDVVNRITGIEVRETVPDRVLDAAEQVEFVDLPADELLRRLEEGKVYLPERAALAARSFFRRGNLLALRELALRRTAAHVDADVRGYRRDHEIEATWPVAERILVCVRPNPESDALVRAGWRMAAGLHAECIVAHVETVAQRPLSAPERTSLAGTLKLAEDLGAETATLRGDSVSEAVIAFARERNVSRIVVGKPVHARWRDRLKGSLLDEIVRGSGGIEVVVIPGGRRFDEAPRSAAAPPAAAGRPFWADLLPAIAVVAACTLVGRPMLGRFAATDMVMIYILGVALLATLRGWRASALAAVLGVAVFDFLFVPPYLTFSVHDRSYAVTFSIMLAVSFLISGLAARVRAQAEAAQARERRTNSLYALSRDLASALSVQDVAHAASRHVSELLHGPARVLLPASGGALEASPGALGDPARESAVAAWVFEHGRPAGLGTDTLPAAASLYVPLPGSGAVLGVLAVRPADGLLPFSPDNLSLVQTLARQTALGVERARLAEEAESAQIAVRTERLRNTLLTSASHDLRTPLAAITGAASSLLQPVPLQPAVERELKESIYDEAESLNRLVTNLLDMTRLESGALPLQREWHSVEELVGAALARLERALRGRRVAAAVPADLPLIFVDGVLLEQVLVNLLDNALKHTPAGAAIGVAARATGDAVVVEVSDDGPGLPPGDEERVFEKFYRGGARSAGFGLGLPICRAIVEAHGGHIRAEAGRPVGAAFVFTLPRTAAPAPPGEEDAAVGD